MTDRRTLSALTIVVLLVLLLVGGFVGWQGLSAPLPGLGEDAPLPGQRCEQGLTRGEVVHSDDITVSVFNAGSRTGLAGRTQQELLARGFIAGDVGNAPGDLADVREVRILAPARRDPAARLVARQFGIGTRIQTSQVELGPGVEVVVGDGFTGLKKAPRRLKAETSGSGC